MRLIDADELKEYKFVGNKFVQICGRTNGKTLENINKAYQQGWNDCLDTIIDNTPTVEPEPYFEKAEKDKRIYERGFEDGQNARPQGEAECMEEDAKQASIPYTYSAPQHDWKCGYPDSTGGKTNENND